MAKLVQTILCGALFLSGSHAFVQVANKNVATTVSTTSRAFLPKATTAFSPASSSSSPSSTVLFMGWGPDPIWKPGKVVANDAACPSELCVSLKVKVDPEVAAEYKFPGQYVQVRLNEETEPLFLAIASAPSSESGEFEFLVKKNDKNGWMTGAAAGGDDVFEVSQVLGGGFPVEENLDGFKFDFPTQNVLLFAAGSGIAPIKAAMEDPNFLAVQGNSSDGTRTARLYYGVRTPDDLCFMSKFKEWEEKGFQIVPVLSDPSASWEGRSGYVQNALEEDGVAIARNTGALMCGMKGMTESVKDILTKAGVFEGRVLTNF